MNKSGTVILLKNVDGKVERITLQNVLYAPGMIFNLISSSQARRNGFQTEIDSDQENPTLGILKLIHKRS